MQSKKQHKNLFPTSPSWIANAVVYQIFPDRFRRSRRLSDTQNLTFQDWDMPPLPHSFYGGDLYGVIEKLNYLEKFGINCIYLNPIFSSAANHRYHTYDYFQVDPILGGNSALEDLIDAIHRRGMRIILDGVFNHCGRGFWAFHHLLENGASSPYRDWFCVHKWPLSPYTSCAEDAGYSCWWNDPALPKFNHNHPHVREYLLSVATYWIERGIDGWRLDVPDEVPSDFWVEFRRKVKDMNPNTWLIGEIWGDARKWLNGDQFDGVMNYRIGWSSLSWTGGNNLNKSYINAEYPIKELNGNNFLDILSTTLEWYSEEVNYSHLNLLDSHDVPRALHTLENDIAAFKLALFLLFLQPGTPCIYYGSEACLSGGKEPACREPFPWDKPWKTDLRKFINSLVELRKQIPYKCLDKISWEAIEKDGLNGYLTYQNESLAKPIKYISVFINRSRTSWLPFPSDSLKNIFLYGGVDWKNNRLAPQSFIFLKDASFMKGQEN